jgi:glycosyltransferase involved in cell wall biosynthesis
MTLRLTCAVQVWWTIENVRFEVREEHLGRQRWLLRPKRFAHRWCYRNGARFVDGIIVVSDETARAFTEAVGYRGDKVHVVANGADTDPPPVNVHRDDMRRRLGFGPDAHLMTMVGTFKRQKGHAYLVEAAASAVAEFPHLHVLLVGDGELAEAIANDVDARGLRANVHLLGTRRDVPELLAASDSFVLPSLWEGLPVALVEAMASGLAVIATAVSGTRQVMIDGTTGWIVPPGDASSLAHAMIELLSDPARAAKMAVEARARVLAHFSAASQAELLATLFRRAAARDEPAGVRASTCGAAQ